MKTPLHILITGGSGYLGKALTDYLLNDFTMGADTADISNVSHETHNTKVTWVSRNPNIEHSADVAVISYEVLKESTQNFDVIINLAGAGVLDKRWTDIRKQQLHESRLQPTQAVLDYISQASIKPKLLISSSAIGWYGVQKTGDNSIINEDSPCVKPDFAHQLCDKWENLTLTANTLVPDMPIAILRTGVVFSGEGGKDGGMIGQLKLPFSLGLGGRLGSGEQMMSWISRKDWVRATIFIIEQNLSQASQELSQPLENKQIYNLTAPNAIKNTDFTKAVGNWLHRPTFFAQPTFLLKLIFGEGSTLILDGQNIYPQKLLDLGFEFEDKEVIDALQSYV